ncbi:hypothetical protein KSP40_PGU002841 [Platanthera guangdongensis]|uniref:Probable zinc-ribbon domain-containing protein n=1 Tax=Platanthera guangdongensis TaxID=2320717 RepID=A0ABR2MC03_9ASPA
MKSLSICVFGSKRFNHRIYRAPLHPYEPCNQNKVSLTRKESQPCRPAAGAAPFIVCYNCSEVLQIPEQIMQIGKHQHKLRCRSCSLLISFELDGTRQKMSFKLEDEEKNLKRSLEFSVIEEKAT